MNRDQMTTFVGQEELPELQRKRAEAIAAAGKKWLFHPSNFVKRKPQTDRAGRRALALLLVGFILAHAGNDCDGRCVQTTEVTP